ncbi:MAG: hypothetical protein GY862_21205, partial [Gammaproteobacteria bacterium]|nr:hypothetical protein [Gammaproteobacteria bacterium]
GRDKLETLVAYTSIPSLGSTQSYDIFNGAVEGMPGEIVIYPAYRLDSDQSITYPVTPVRFSVTP